jgi:transcriptional regulator MraZ
VFKGTYHYRIDAKGRLPVPPPFRRALSGSGGEQVVLTLIDQCLAAFPAGEWARLEEQLRRMPTFSRPVKALARHLASRASECALDVQGRILLPPALRAAAGLSREALVVGVVDRFEVWAPETWEQFLKESERFLDDVSLDVPWPLPGGSSTGEP